MIQEKTFICACHSREHQLAFWKDDDIVATQVHLTTYRNFWKRLWVGLKYAFGYKCVYGNFDEFIWKEEDLKQLKTFLNAR